MQRPSASRSQFHKVSQFLRSLAARCSRRPSIGIGQARSAVAAAFVLVAAACSGDSGPGTKMEDGPGQVAIVAEETRIDGTAEMLVPFTRNPVGAIAVAPDGTMAISQPQQGQVRFYSTSAGLQGTFGRRGSGPGEFVRSSRIGWVGDSLWVYDPGAGRIAVISPNREYVRSLVLPSEAHPVAGNPDLPRFTQIAALGLLPGDSIVVAMHIPFGGSASHSFEGYTAVGVVQPDGTLHRLLARIPHGQASIPTPTGGMVGIPFANVPVQSISLDATRFAVAVADVKGESAGTFRLTVVNELADTVFSRRFPYMEVPIPAQVGDSAIDARLAALSGNPMAATTLRREYELPDIYPPVTNIVIGRDSTVWVEQAVSELGRPYLVLSPEGEPIGLLHLPGNSEVSVAERDMVWAIETDDLGVESLVRYRVAWQDE